MPKQEHSPKQNSRARGERPQTGDRPNSPEFKTFTQTIVAFGERLKDIPGFEELKVLFSSKPEKKEDEPG